MRRRMPVVTTVVTPPMLGAILGRRLVATRERGIETVIVKAIDLRLAMPAGAAVEAGVRAGGIGAGRRIAVSLSIPAGMS
jgi:hypothetical protein